MREQKILIPLDGSRFAECAIPFALRAAKTLGAEVALVSAYDDRPMVGGWTLDPEPVREWFEEYVEKIASKIETGSGIQASHTVIGGPVVRTLVEYIQRSQPTMVMMSTHGRGPLSRAWLGSIADRVVRYASMPVWLVRPDNGEMTLEPAPPINRVLLALDGSDRAEASIEWARRVGAEGAEYTLLQVVPPPHAVSPYLPQLVQETKERLEEARQHAEDYLKRVEDRLRQESVRVHSDVVISDAVAGSIIGAAEKERSDLTVITTHGRTGLGRVLLGSVADKVVRGAHGSVLIVRTAKMPAEGESEEAPAALHHAHVR